jgi:protein-disulfide isomerase
MDVKRKILVLVTALVAILGIIFFGSLRESSLPPPKESLKIEGHPLVGRRDAKIILVLMEDFLCPACREFVDTVLPLIQEKYIDTGIAYCVFVPLGLSEESKKLANAALAVYRLAPLRFLDFVYAIYNDYRGTSSKEELLALAKRVGEIDLAQLETCIDVDCFQAQIAQNLEWAKRIMGKDFGVPALYVNGIPTSTASFDGVAKRIERFE